MEKNLNTSQSQNYNQVQLGSLRFLGLTISAILGTAVVYGLLSLESFIHSTNNPEYGEMIEEVAESVITDFGLFLIFFLVVYPYQYIILIFQQFLEWKSYSAFRIALIIIMISTFLYSAGFTIIFRSPYLGFQDLIKTFGVGTLIFGAYFLVNLSTYLIIVNINLKKNKSFPSRNC